MTTKKNDIRIYKIEFLWIENTDHKILIVDIEIIIRVCILEHIRGMSSVCSKDLVIIIVRKFKWFCTEGLCTRPLMNGNNQK